MQKGSVLFILFIRHYIVGGIARESVLRDGMTDSAAFDAGVLRRAIPQSPQFTDEM